LPVDGGEWPTSKYQHFILEDSAPVHFVGLQETGCPIAGLNDVENNAVFLPGIEVFIKQIQ
jgi:hypothetical protein